MEKAHEGLAPFLKFGSSQETMDLADYIDGEGNLVIPVDSLQPKRAVPDREREEIRQALQGRFPSEQLNDLAELLHLYIRDADDNLAAMDRLAKDLDSPAGQAIVRELRRYLDDPHDAFPEAQYGTVGRLDDSMLIHNTAYRIAEAGLVPADRFPVDWQVIAVADGVVRTLLPFHVVGQLEQRIAVSVQALVQEASGYSPQLTRLGEIGRAHV